MFKKLFSLLSKKQGYSPTHFEKTMNLDDYLYLCRDVYVKCQEYEIHTHEQMDSLKAALHSNIRIKKLAECFVKRGISNPVFVGSKEETEVFNNHFRQINNMK